MNALLIQLDTTNNAVYSEISSIKIIHDTIYIFDRDKIKSLYIFSINGSFIRKISKIGRGPDEYINPVDFDIDESSGDVFILDWTTKKLLTYGNDGNLKQEKKLNGRYTSFTVFKDRVFCLNPFPVKIEAPMFQCYNLNGKHILSALKSKNIAKDGLKFRYGNNFYKNINHIRFFISENNIVYSYENDTISQFLSLNFSRGLLKNNKALPFLYAYSENDDYAFFKTFIKNIPYDIFYNFKTKKVFLFCYAEIVDDITNLPVKLLGIWDNKVVGVVEAQNIPYIKSLIAKGEVNHPLLSNYVNNYKADMLVLYELK